MSGFQRDAKLADCEHCGHFQDWPYDDSVCGSCGWPNPERMAWAAEFAAIPAAGEVNHAN